jgi:hypothetical protein
VAKLMFLLLAAVDLVVQMTRVGVVAVLVV